MHFPLSNTGEEGCICEVPLPALPSQARKGSVSLCQTSQKTEMQRYRMERSERKALCKSGTLPSVIKGSMDFTPALAAFHLQREIKKRRTIHNTIHCVNYTIHLHENLKVWAEGSFEGWLVLARPYLINKRYQGKKKKEKVCVRWSKWILICLGYRKQVSWLRAMPWMT